MTQGPRGSQPSLILAILDALTGTVVAVVRDMLIKLVGSLGLAAIVVIAIPIGLVVLFGVVAVGFVLASFVGMTSPIGIVLVYGSIAAALVAMAKVYLAMYRRLAPLGRRFGVLEDDDGAESEVPATTVSPAEAMAAEEALWTRVSDLDAQLGAPPGPERPDRSSNDAFSS